MGEQRVIDAGRKSKGERLIGQHSTNDKVECQLNRFVRKLGIFKRYKVGKFNR